MKTHECLIQYLFIAIVFTILCFPLIVNGYEQATVRNIVDGDTLKVSYQGQKELVRLIGIDTPESRKNKKAFKDSRRSGDDVESITSMGKEATNYVKGMVKPGDVINLEFDTQRRDKYRRLLCYVYLPNGRMLNEEIIKAGYASPMTYPPNVKYQENFLKYFREARDGGRGLFKR
jgi:micrococcal nuclease